MTTRRELLALTASGFLSGCTGGKSLSSRTETVTFESLVRQIKHDVGTYVVQHQDEAMPKGLVCAGNVAFTISKVKMTVTAVLDTSGSINAGLKIPLDLVTVDASASAAQGSNNTITTSLVIYPISAAKDAEFEDESVAVQRLTTAPPASPQFVGTPITDVLNRLKADLLKTADTPPCFNFGDGEQKENVVKWAFTVTRKASGGGKLSLALFTLGADTSRSQSYANTIEVSFIATGEGFG